MSPPEGAVTGLDHKARHQALQPALWVSNVNEDEALKCGDSTRSPDQHSSTIELVLWLHLDKRFTSATVQVKSKPIYKVEKLWVNEYRTLIINLQSKIYSIHVKIYLPAALKLIYAITYAVY